MNVLNTKTLSITLTSALFLGLMSASALDAAQQLDIRPYEAADECDPTISQIRVTVNGVSFGGMLTVGLYDDPNHFLMKHGRKRVQMRRRRSARSAIASAGNPQRWVSKRGDFSRLSSALSVCSTYAVFSVICSTYLCI